MTGAELLASWRQGVNAVTTDPANTARLDQALATVRTELESVGLPLDPDAALGALIACVRVTEGGLEEGAILGTCRPAISFVLRYAAALFLHAGDLDAGTGAAGS